MACDALTTGRGKPCFNRIAGIKNVYFSTDDLGAITYAADGVTVQTFAGTPDNTFDAGTINKDLDNGTTFFGQALEVNFTKLDKLSHKEIKLLIWASPTTIVETYAGDYLVMGLANGSDVTGGSIPTGGAKGDFAGYNLTMTAEEEAPANFLVTDIPTTTATISASQIDP